MAGDVPPVDRDLLRDAVELARRAGDLTLQWFEDPSLKVDRKGDGTPVTVADRAAERFLREQLEDLYPDDAVLGEEEGATPGTTGRRWIIDPIDGTKSFTRGVPLYTTLVAVEDEHGPAVGVIAVPALEQCVWAGRGRGAYADGEEIGVSTRDRLTGAVVTTSAFDAWDDDALLRVKRAGAQLRTWGDGYGYVLVATGRADAMVDPVAAEWDLAPMTVIMAEAGGRMTSTSGEPSTTTGSGLATNGALHDEMVRLLTG